LEYAAFATIDGLIKRQRYKLLIVQYFCTRRMKLANLIYEGDNMYLDRKFQKNKPALEAKGNGQL